MRELQRIWGSLKVRLGSCHHVFLSPVQQPHGLASKSRSKYRFMKGLWSLCLGCLIRLIEASYPPQWATYSKVKSHLCT
jgi:hypothetical protein